uniref:virulence associated lipoprotein n=1 Tax=Borreliella californiensis TaxID=373543 RepID=UPI003B21F6B9
MKYHIIANIFVFLFLACKPDFNTNQEDSKYPSNNPNITEGPNIKIKNTLLNDFKNSIETANEHKEKYIKNMEKEPKDQYGVQAFKALDWGEGTEKASENTERSIRFRRHTYTILSALDTHELKEFSDIIMNQRPICEIFNTFSILGEILDIVIDHLHPKKDKLNKLDISDLKTLKNSFDKILSIIESVSGMSKQLILDYRNNKNLIKTDINKLKSHINKLDNESQQQAREAKDLQKFIVSKYNP